MQLLARSYSAVVSVMHALLVSTFLHMQPVNGIRFYRLTDSPERKQTHTSPRAKHGPLACYTTYYLTSVGKIGFQRRVNFTGLAQGDAIEREEGCRDDVMTRRYPMMPQRPNYPAGPKDASSLVFKFN